MKKLGYKILISIILLSCFNTESNSQCSTVEELLCEDWALNVLIELTDGQMDVCNIAPVSILELGIDAWVFDVPNMFGLGDSYYYDCDGELIQECSFTFLGSPPICIPDITYTFLTLPVEGLDWNCGEPLPLCYPYEDLVITELFYNPPSENTNLQYIELTNTSNEDINLSGVKFNQGVSHIFQSFILNEDESVILTKDKFLFEATYSNQTLFNNIDVIQWDSGDLDENGELILLQSPSNETIDRVNFQQGGNWPTTTEGEAIILCNVNSNNDSGQNWSVSSYHTCTDLDGITLYSSPGREENCGTCYETCNGQEIELSPGDSCDDENPNTVNDIYQSDCSCLGTPSSGGDYCTTPQDENIFGLEIGNRCISNGETVCLPIRTFNFTSITSIQFAVKWDSDILNLQQWIAVDEALDPIGDGTNLFGNNELQFFFGFESPQTFYNGQTIFEICYNVIGTSSESDVVFGDYTTGEDITVLDEDGDPLSFFMDCGSVEEIELFYPCELEIEFGDVNGSIGDTILVPVIVNEWSTNAQEVSIPIMYNGSQLGFSGQNPIRNLNSFLSMEGTWNVPTGSCLIADGSCVQPVSFVADCPGCFDLISGTKLFDLEFIIEEPCDEQLEVETSIHTGYYPDSMHLWNFYAIDSDSTFLPVHSNMGIVTIEQCVNQGEDTSSYITTWKTDNPGLSDDRSIVIPTNPQAYTYNYDVDWESNGNWETGFTGDAEHTYDEPGEYTVSIRGSFPHQYFINQNLDNSKLVEVNQWGNIQWQNMAWSFAGCDKLVAINSDDNPNLENVSSLTHVFSGASSFVGGVSNWDVSNVGDFGFAFQNALNFNQSLDSWNLSKGYSTAEMFSGAILFNQDLSSWNVSNISSFKGMFKNASMFNQNIGSWTLSDSNIEEMLDYCGMTTNNYEQTLLGWSQNLLTANGLKLGALTLTYCDTTGRAKLVNDFDWIIEGDIEDEDCTTSDCHPDIDALLALYDSTNGDDWTISTGWGQDCEPCGWFGIQCNDNNRVEIIDLDDNNLIGQLPEELSGANQLFRLELRENSISGEVPNSYSLLTSLVTFNLGSNDLTGEFPLVLTECLNLKGLYLYDNNLSGELPPEIGDLLQLEAFNVGVNNFTGTIPMEFSDLLKLESLNFRANAFQGEIPEWLGDLFRLEFLNLRGNNFTGSIPLELATLSKLKQLYLYNNGLTGSIPAGFGLIDSLETFRLEENNLSGCIPEDLLNLCNQNHDIDLSANPGLDNQDWDNFCSTSSGICIVDEEECSHPDYETLIGLYNSTNGDDWTNNTGWGQDCELCDWYGITCNQSDRVIEIDLSNNNLTGELLSSISEIDGLKTFRIARNTIGGQIPEINSLEQLEIFSVFGNDFTGSIPSLTGLTQLKNFSCSYNQLQGQLPEFESLSNLENFACHNNLIGGPIPDVSQNQNLKRLFLNDNLFTGCYSSVINKLCGWQHRSQYNDYYLDTPGDTLWFYWNDGYNLDRNPDLPWQGDIDPFCDDENQIGEGAPCDDGNLETEDDIIQSGTCTCAGEVPVDCSNSEVFILVEENQEPADSNPSDLAICFDNTVTLSIEDEYILYEWMGQSGLISSDASLIVGGGSYELTVTDIDGCTASSSVTITEQSEVYHIINLSESNFCNSSVQGNPIIDLPSFIEESNADFHVWKDMDGSEIFSPAFYSVDDFDPGVYVLILESYIEGCPPIVSSISIEVISCCESVEVLIDSQICNGMTIIVNNTEYSIGNLSGIETVVDAVDNGCDSTYVVDLEVVFPTETIQVEGCEGDEVEVNGMTYTLMSQALQEVDQTLPSLQYPECDSTLTIQFEIRQPSEVLLDTTLCLGDILVIEGQVYSSEGFYEQLLVMPNSEGCDSTLLLTIRDAESNYTVIDTLICDGAEVIIEGETYSEIGSYQITSSALTQDGCDSIIRLDLGYRDVNVGFLEIEQCNTESMTLNGQTFTPGTNQQDILLSGQSQFGCDSLLMVTVDFEFTGDDCTVTDGEQGILNEDCLCVELVEPCLYELVDDNYIVAIDETYEFDILANDNVADSIVVSILSVSNEDAIIVNYEDQLLNLEVASNFGNDIEIIYEVCEPDCENCAEASVTLVNEKIQDITQTNVIIPDGDGVDDVLRFTEESIVKDSELWIFSREGTILFHTKDYDNTWDASGIPGGVYFYLLKINDVEIKRTLTVIK